MSIQTIREQLRDVPGAERIVMQYDDGGERQAFHLDNICILVSPNATIEEIRAELLEAMK